MTIQIKTVEFTPKRHTFGHIARRLGGDRSASRYQEGTLDLQATENFHYKPLWEPEFWHYDQAKTAVKMADWYKPLDPRQYYYATYNIARANMQQAVERNFTFADERGLLANLPAELKAKIIDTLLPLRHAHWGSNMNMAEICQRGYGTAVTAPCIFSAMDHLGMAQIISRIGLLLDGLTGESLRAAKQTWMTVTAWQGIRKLMEDSLVERDWFHLYVAQTLGMNAVLLRIAYTGLEASYGTAGMALAMLTEFCADWLAEEGRWSDAVIKAVAAESPENNALVSKWAKDWIARAADAAVPLSVAVLGDDTAARVAGEATTAHARALGLAL
ncbi:ferritin family protein [Acidocella aromatica]|uniref:Phenol hydroxylase P1 protein n=1 Tax=Acidocella aromatica TaxID=1303579 RepID=A0A840VN66_9PROT|nr:phenol hydroxylase [Acidocella aromatica]MBB5373031.1 phenol hydroxylase P1 protein [Acidocella aromatica]